MEANHVNTRTHMAWAVRRPGQEDPKIILAFDFDGTLVSYARSRTHGLLIPPEFLRWCAKVGSPQFRSIRVVIMSNRSDAESKLGDKRGCAVLNYLKLNGLWRDDAPAVDYSLAMGSSRMRKPLTGMFDWYIEQVAGHHCPAYFCGDAAGRRVTVQPVGRKRTPTVVKDFAATDLAFARNTGMIFHTPERFAAKFILAAQSRIGDRSLVAAVRADQDASPFGADDDAVADGAADVVDRWLMLAAARPPIRERAEVQHVCKIVGDIVAANAHQGDAKSRTPQMIHKSYIVLLCMVGFPGSGKSRLAATFTKLLEKDGVMSDTVGYDTHGRAETIARITNPTSDTHVLIVDNTSPTEKDQNFVSDAATRNGAKCVFVYVDVPFDVCVHLDAARCQLGVRPQPLSRVAMFTARKRSREPPRPDPRGEQRPGNILSLRVSGAVEATDPIEILTYRYR